MYQAPLHYVLSALLDRGLGLLGATSTEHALRWIPLACGALQVEVAYRALRLAFPDREDVQCVGLWIAGLLPVNLYVSQFVGNEPLAGLASAIVALRCVRAIARPEETHPFREAAWIGLALGVALLSKMTAVIWIPLTGVALIGGALARERKAGPAVARAGLAFGVAGLVAGWFYARNWIELGRPLVGNWDWKESNRIWWQDPGYRIPEHFTRFGRSLVQPVYSAVHGYWDAMYSTLWTEGLFSGSMSPPPWNLDWMLAGAWLGLPITSAILAGMLGAGRLTEPAGRVRRFAVLAVLLHVLASLDFYLRLPIYSSAKATYLLGLLPCIAILAAAGFAPLLRRGWSRAAATAMLFVFGAASYAAYFVI
jgi:hypothetical protein